MATAETSEWRVISTLPKLGAKCVNLPFGLGQNPVSDLDYFPVARASDHLDLQSVGGHSRAIGIEGHSHTAKYSAMLKTLRLRSALSRGAKMCARSRACERTAAELQFRRRSGDDDLHKALQ